VRFVANKVTLGQVYLRVLRLPLSVSFNRCSTPVFIYMLLSGVPRNFVPGEGVQQIQLRTEDRENGDLGGGSPLVRGSGGKCNFVQEISFHIVKFS